jgi:hypothetical protein
MKRSSILFNLLGAVGLLGLVSGCGSGGGGATTTTSTGGATSGTAAATGTITGFGSVVVNGKRFDTRGSSFIVDGEQNKKQSDLKLGMTVTVTGSFNGDQWSADSVVQKDAVEGSVQFIAADRLSLVVMGQAVMVDSATKIDDSPGPNSLIGSILNLKLGDIVEVNGHIRPDGLIQATFIERKDPGTVTPEVRGFVIGHNAAASTFQIGNLTVNYLGVDIRNMPNPVGNAWDGLFVEVRETDSISFNPATMTLTVTGVLLESQGLGSNIGKNKDEFEVEGYVTQVVSSGDFFIGTTHVQTTPEIIQGGTIDDIVVGAKLSVQGRLANGILTAKQVIHVTRATAVTIGFDGMSPGLFGGIEAGFIILANGNNDWSVVGDAGNNFISSTLNGSSFYVESFVLDGEFTVQGFDVSSIGGASTFHIVGLADRDDQNAELFRFSYSVQDGAGFERISLADELRRLTSSFNPLANNDTTDDARTSFNVNLDKVQRVIISVAHGDGVTSRVDSVHVGTGGQ